MQSRIERRRRELNQSEDRSGASVIDLLWQVSGYGEGTNDMTYRDAVARAKRISEKIQEGVFVIDILGIEDTDCRGYAITKSAPYDVYTAEGLLRNLGDLSSNQIDARIHASIG
jgi:hypothetical protein